MSTDGGAKRVIAELNRMRLLIVDDDVVGAELLEQVLAQAGYANVLSTGDPTRVNHLCATEKPDLVLLDLDMPRLSAFQAIEEIRYLTDEPESPPVLVLTADTPDARHRALSMGARDFVTKPMDETELLLRVRNVLQMRQLQHQLKDRNELLTEAVARRTGELESARVECLSLLASMSEYHDDDTFQHTQRVGVSAALIARALELPELFVATIRDAAPLHDIGKVGMSRRILLKPGQLTPAEWTHMTRHVEIGARILASAQSPALRLAAEIARTHHERWDGTGYLAGLAGEDIPIAGRITALADVFDVLTHERPYKPIWDRDRALAEIDDQAGRQFDPRVVEAFTTVDLRAISDPPPGEDARHAA
jgi:putative two-component system response regulator